MLAAGTWVVCPVCRLYGDRFAAPTPEDLAVRCPWCQMTSTAAEFATCAERESCDACGHPLTLHVRYYTPDGEPPKLNATVLPEAGACTACGCTRQPRAVDVRID